MEPNGTPNVLRLVTNTVVQISGNLGASLISLVTFIVVTRGLGAEGFGTLTTAFVYLMIPVLLADVGLTTGVLREISANPDRTAPAMSAALPLRAFVSAIAVVAGVAIAFILPFNAEVQRAIAIGSVGSFFALMSQALLPVLQARLMMHWAILGTIVGRVAILGLTIAVVAADGGIQGVMIANVTGLALTFLLQLVAVARIVSLAPTIDLAYWRMLLRGSVAVGVALALAQIYFRIDTLMIAAFRSPVEVGLYGAGIKLVELSELVGAAIGISIFPLLARFVQVDLPRASDLFQRSFDLLIAAAMPLLVVMAFAATPIVVLISGEEFREAGDAVQLLAPWVLANFVGGLTWRGLVAFGEDRQLVILAFLVLCLNVGLNLIAIPAYGFRGAAVISVLTQFSATTAALVLLRRRHGFQPRLGYAAAVLPAAAVMAAVLVAVGGPTLVRIALATAVYAGILLLAPGTVRELAASSLLGFRERSSRR